MAEAESRWRIDGRQVPCSRYGAGNHLHVAVLRQLGPHVPLSEYSSMYISVVLAYYSCYCKAISLSFWCAVLLLRRNYYSNNLPGLSGWLYRYEHFLVAS